MKIIRPLQISDASMISSNVLEDGYERWSSTTTYAVGDAVLPDNPSSDVTIDITTDYVTWPANNLAADTPVVFKTTGALPTGISENVPYYTTATAGNAWRAIAWSSTLGLFAAVSTSGTGNRVMTSPDGITWNGRTSAVDNNWTAIAWSSTLGLFAAVASSGTGNRVMTSI